VIPPAVLAGAYPHQKRELILRCDDAHPVAQHFALWWQPGTGKTLVYIRQAMAMRLAGDLRPHLYLCPSALTAQVTGEARRFWPGAIVVRLRSGTDRLPPRYDIVVVGYHLLPGAPQLVAQLMAVSWASIIFDESHYLRSLGAARTILCLGPHGQACLAHRAVRRVFGTGSALINHNGDLYPTVRRLEVRALARLGANGRWRNVNPREFFERYVRYEQKWIGSRMIRVPAGSQHSAELFEALRGIVSILTLDEAAPGLPPMVVAALLLDAEDILEQLLATGEVPREVVDQMLDLLAEAACGDERAEAAAWRLLSDWAGPLSTYRRQIGLLKAPHVAEIVRERIEGGETRACVFFHHRAVGEIIRDALIAAGISAVLLYGGTGGPARERALFDFNIGKLRVLVLQFDAGGVGLNLQAARYSILAELPWTAAALTQALRRTRRLGQTSPTLAHVALVPGSLDEAVAGIIMRKAQEETELTRKEVVTW
jgi:SWI/SNF-related matrix-associated actin-dependent regulator 1 of chromatin subfamily A